VGEDGVAIIIIIIIKNLDLIFLKASRSAKMEIAGVFVAKGAISYLGPLAPIGGFVIIYFTKLILGRSAKPVLQGREVADFLELVKERNNRAAVDKVNRRKGMLASPSLDRRSDAFEPKTKAANGGKVIVGGPNAKPITSDERRDDSVGEPRVFHAEDRAAGSFSSGRNMERDVIGDRAGRGGESSIRESKAPIRVNQHPV
jgi:hypothetical protein